MLIFQEIVNCDGDFMIFVIVEFVGLMIGELCGVWLGLMKWVCMIIKDVDVYLFNWFKQGDEDW